jgi:hypothetical protein
MSENMALAEFLILILVTKRLLPSQRVLSDAHQRPKTWFPTAQPLIPKQLLATAGAFSGLLLI